jgi:hypothetical protein
MEDHKFLEWTTSESDSIHQRFLYSEQPLIEIKYYDCQRSITNTALEEDRYVTNRYEFFLNTFKLYFFVER